MPSVRGGECIISKIVNISEQCLYIATVIMIAIPRGNGPFKSAGNWVSVVGTTMLHTRGALFIWWLWPWFVSMLMTMHIYSPEESCNCHHQAQLGSKLLHWAHEVTEEDVEFLVPVISAQRLPFWFWFHEANLWLLISVPNISHKITNF